MNNPSRKLVLLSGGLDSMVNLAEAAGDETVAGVLFVNYGQIAAEPEKIAAEKQCDFYGVELRTVELPWYRTLLPRALKNDKDAGNSNDNEVWAPNRNGLLVAIAASIAEAEGLSGIGAGFNAEEAATFPDNSPEFITAYNELLELSTKNAVKLVSYTLGMDKTTIVRRAMELDAPLDKVYSCYTSGPKMCGRCISCIRLINALEVNGVFDQYRLLFSRY